MAEEKKALTLQISEGYRAARRTTSIICAIAIAWSAAQFEFKAISIVFGGSVDLSRASIPLIIACVIGYMTARLIIEYAMQSVEVRRWPYAQADFKLSIFLVRATIIVLAASGLSRSVETILYIGLAVLGVLIGSRLFLYMGIMALTPLLHYLKSRKGHSGIAFRVIESLFWTELIMAIAFLTLIVVIGVASLTFEPLRSLWTIPPSPIHLGIFILTCVAIVISVYLQRIWYSKLFAKPPAYNEQIMPDGSIRRTYTNYPPAAWDWSCQSVDSMHSTKTAHPDKHT